MDIFVTTVAVLFYGTVTQAHEYLRIGGGDIVSIPNDNSEYDNSRILALIIVEENDSEETENLDDGKPKTPIMLPWIDAANLDDTEDEDEDTSEDSNTDEYPSSETTDTDRESNYYHEEDYLRNELKDLVELKNLKDKSDILRKRWKSCRKTAAKVCKEACNVSYKNACDQFKCKRKLKKAMKKECKTNCKDMFFN